MHAVGSVPMVAPRARGSSSRSAGGGVVGTAGRTRRFVSWPTLSRAIRGDVLQGGRVRRESRVTGPRGRSLFVVLVATLTIGTGSVVVAAVAPSVKTNGRVDASMRVSGGGWAPVTLLLSGHGIIASAVTCATASLCVAVGAEGSEGVELSRTHAWSAPIALDRGGGLAGVSCSPGGTCEAVGASASFGSGGVSYRLAKGSWTSGTATAVALVSVSCPDVNFCAGVDDASPHGHAIFFNGTSWSRPVTLAASAVSVSCPTTRFCAAVSQSGDVLYDHGGTWSRATRIDPVGTLVSISCARQTFCVAVDANGDVVHYARGRWSKPRDVDGGTSLTGVSCASASFCAAVDTAGAVVTFDGYAWSSPRTIDRAVQFTSVSCPTATFCVAVGQNASMTGAYVTTYGARTATSSRSVAGKEAL